MREQLRILMVQGKGSDVTNPAAWVWANRQADSLLKLGYVIDTYAFEDRRSLLGLLRGSVNLKRQINEVRADLVHVHFGAAQGLMAVLFSHKPVIISFCGSDLLGNYNSRGQKTWSGHLSVWLSQLSALGASHCIAKTRELKEALWFSFCQDKCVVIPNGVDLDQFKGMVRSDARAALGWTHDDPVLLFMDRKGAWVKNSQLAYMTFQKAKQVVPKLRMHIVEKEPPDRMPLFLNAADVLLITSFHEGSNNTVKEALACGLPVVACPVGDIPELLANVSPSAVVQRDVALLANAIAEVVRLDARSNGREQVEHLSLQSVAQRVIKTYQEVIPKIQK